MCDYFGSCTAEDLKPVLQRASQTSKIIISNLGLHIRFEDIEHLLNEHGRVVSCDKLTSKDQNTQTVAVTYDTPEQAQIAVNQLNGVEVEGKSLKVELAVEKRGKRNPRGPGAAFGGLPGQNRQTDFPLRILVGAIIGRQGSTIRQITQQTRARVDVHRKDNVGSLEKAITIYGNPDNCTNACKRILEVMQQEANNTNKGEISLKILAHNNLIGRIIGKGGNTIKRIMQETDTKITVSSINDINSFNLERIITVKGSIENMSRAESQISSKLRQSYENDLQAMAPQTMMFPGLHPMAMMATAGIGYGSRGLYSGQAPYPGMYPAGSQSGGDTQETTYLYIPNNAVGAIIGTKGSHIRNIIRFSGASVKIAPIDETKPQETQNERRVTIVGSPEAQWKAQYLIFEKMREEGFVAGSDDVRLTVEIMVPSSQVGRIIVCTKTYPSDGPPISRSSTGQTAPIKAERYQSIGSYLIRATTVVLTRATFIHTACAHGFVSAYPIFYKKPLSMPSTCTMMKIILKQRSSVDVAAPLGYDK
ncbi:unnamed protein product [Diabrotica balteata]|uniref:RRM domain-containing protein n=1 Tax=Diabrotica balteata TaxID=107213 RepID=A0A9N9X8R9_DIABA|nr:unnamed protein product [Diabrotica balteata]